MTLLSRILGFVAFLVAIAGGLLLAGVALAFVAGFLAVVLLLSLISRIGRPRKEARVPTVLEGQAVRVPDADDPMTPRPGIEAAAAPPPEASAGPKPTPPSGQNSSVPPGP